MKKVDKDWARAKIFAIIDTPTAQLLGEDPRDKLVSKMPRNRLSHGERVSLKRERYSPENEQMQLFAKYLADELKKRGFNEK
jgi:hypothetical protein